MVERQPRSRKDKPTHADRDGYSETGRHQQPLAGAKLGVDPRRQVGSGIARTDPSRQGEALAVVVPIESAQGDLDHGVEANQNGTAPAVRVARVGALLVWMDLEMTGLDPAKHVIVEIATLITDDELNVIAEGPDLVIKASEDELAAMDDVVTEMHTKSGLLGQIRSSTVTLEEAGEQTLAFLKTHIEKPRTVPLCGNSIGMDRRFLAIYLNDIEEYLHYRSVDVSTIKELARRWYPAVMAKAPRKDAGHRALDDITESINELRWYRERVFTTADADTGADVAVQPG